MSMKLNRLKAVLADKGRSESWLANAIGVSGQHVSGWCCNKTQPRLERLYQISKALDCKMSDLIRE